MAATCVFCGRPISATDTVAGRPPNAAHAVCADAALVDDAHWDAVAAASGDLEADESPPPATTSRRAGCVVIPIAVVALVLLASCRRSRRVSAS